MDAISKQNLYLLGAFCAFGLVLCQTDDVHLMCLPEKWVSEKNVTLQCSLLKSSYPSKCKTSTTNSVIFRRKIGQGAYDDECTLSDILGVCTSSGNCSCDKTQNATYYNFEYTFKANDDSEGYWDCSVPCFDGLTTLTSSAYDCDNRKVIDFPETVTEGSKTKEDLDVEKKKSEDLTISLGVLLPVAVVIIVLLVVVIFRLLWKTLFSCVICVIVCVDNEKKKTLHYESTKTKLKDFVSEHFTMHCCCCCCCSWLRWCCLGKLMLRGPKGVGNDGGVEGGILASCEGCSMGCVWCLSFVQNVKVDVHDIEDNQVSVLITLTSPLSWYSEAEDMPEKVKKYIREQILQEPVKELRHTSKPSMHLGVGCKAGSPDTRNEPPVDYPAGSGR